MGRSVARIKKRLEKKARRGFRGYPLATVAFYGPDDQRASKVVASIMDSQDEGPVQMRKWYSEHADVRHDADILEEVIAFIAGVRRPQRGDARRDHRLSSRGRIDYEGSVCPECPFWANRDRWTGEVVH